MKSFNELLGFAVLTGPLWLILILLPVSIWIAVKIAKRFKPGGIRFAGGVGVFLLLFFLPFSDEIVGRIYLNHLCATEAGVKVYQTVELPAEYWGVDGKPKFLNARGVLSKEVLGDRFKWHSVSEPSVNWFIKIDKKRWLLRDGKSKRDLGEKVTFIRYYGWLNQFSPASRVGESCRDVWADKYGQKALLHKENLEERKLALEIFIPQVSN